MAEVPAQLYLEWIKNYLIGIDGTITEGVPNEELERMATCMPYPGTKSKSFLRRYIVYE
jgi:hypothetical protein